MKYSIESAMEYSKKDKLDEWLQLYLRDDSYNHSNPNIPLADGLLLEERFYSALKKLNINKYYVIIWGNKEIEKSGKLDELIKKRKII